MFYLLDLLLHVIGFG
ncbi:hypothetical protein [Candidatus Pantoea persica]